MAIGPGTQLGPYQVVLLIGGGGMGVVYKARDQRLDRSVAVKLLPPELTRDETAKRRFLQEAKAASALDHPNICTIHEINETQDGQLYLVMAYYEGETLKEKIDPWVVEARRGDRDRYAGCPGAHQSPRCGAHPSRHQASEP